MATAVDDTYSAASGETIYGGREAPVEGLPEWLPAVGSRGNVSLNTLYDTRVTGNSDSRLNDDLRGLLSAWCSTTYAPNLGRYGSIIAFGGGHTDGCVNSVHRYDIENRLWTRLTDPSPVAVTGTLDRQVLSDANGEGQPSPPYGRATNDLWADAGKTTVLDGALAATHTYGLMGWMRPEMAGNTNGMLICVPFQGWTHYLDFDDLATGWQRFPTYMQKAAVYGAIVVDHIRNGVTGVCSPQLSGFASSIGWQDWSTTEVTSSPAGMFSGALFSNPVMFHDEEEDLYLLNSASSRVFEANRLAVIDPQTGTNVRPTVTGGPSTSGYNSGTLEWVSSQKKLVWWSGADTTLWTCAPTGDIRTEPWAWTSQDVPGDAISPYDGNIMYKRLHWVQELGSFFIVTRHQGPVQCWRVTV